MFTKSFLLNLRSSDVNAAENKRYLGIELNYRTALAVGGLYDFYSGQISIAPMWMRELGLERIWILMQEPKSQFNRYVIGTPLFLIRTFVFNRASRGF
jgi:UDP-N-acetyl-D-mannosaminuronic acid transferase (WecB/TagA/CpsF family)